MAVQISPLLQRSPDSAAMVEYWEETEIILRGEKAVRLASEMLLKKLPGESREQYNFRLSGSKLTNIYSDILGALSAKPFEEEISLVEGDGMAVPPQQIFEFVENVDGYGNNITVFSGKYFRNAINDAISFVFIDYPDSPGIRTIAQARAANIRPTWSVVLAKNVLEMEYSSVGGVSILTRVRILEPGIRPDPDRVRIMWREETGAIHWELWVVDSAAGDVLQKEGVLSIDEIPLVPLSTGDQNGDSLEIIPPLESAFSLQKTLYRQESQLEFAKSMTAFPMLSASGVSPKLDANGAPVKITVGPQTVLYAPFNGDGNAGKWEYIEPGAQSLKFLADDVKETKQDLRELGKQPLTAQAGLTVITTAYAAGKSRSAVKQWGLLLKDALENALVITCKWLNITDYDPEISVYDGYDDLSAEDFSDVMDLRRNGDISQKTTWTEAKRRGILSAEFDPKSEMERILNEVPGDGDTEF